MSLSPPSHPLLLLLLAAVAVAGHCFPGDARAWGPGIHTYTNWKALEQVRAAGKWKGIHTRAFVAGAFGPDIWWMANKSDFPKGMEHDMELALLMLRQARTIKEASWAMGYAGHITSDGPGHRIYIDPNGDRAGHTIRDGMAGLTLFGSFEGYPHNKVDLDLHFGWYLDVRKGEGEEPGRWSWGAFDEDLIQLVVRGAAEYAKKHPGKGPAPSADTVRAARAGAIKGINLLGTGMSICAYYAEASLAAENAKSLKKTDDKEFGPGKGPELMKKAVDAAIANTVQFVFSGKEIAEALAASGLSKDDRDRLIIGPPPSGAAPPKEPAAGEQLPTVDGGAVAEAAPETADESGCGCVQGAGEGGTVLAIALLVAALLLRRRARVVQGSS